MNVFKKIIFVIAFVAAPLVFVFAQDNLDYGIPQNTFPEPPNRESATAVVNIDLDQYGLNGGDNELHIDEATQVKFIAHYNKETRRYLLKAFTPEQKEVKVKVLPCDINPSCVFAQIGPDWINVLCSKKYIYSPDADKKTDPAVVTQQERKAQKSKEEIEKQVMDKINAYEHQSKEGKKEKKSKDKKKKNRP